MRDTSVAAYHKIKTDGLLEGLRLAVYEVVHLHGPLTQGEAYRFHLSSFQQHSVNPRYAELERMKVIRVAGERACKVTGVLCLVWESTECLPIKLEKKKTKSRKEIERELELWKSKYLECRANLMKAVEHVRKLKDERI